MSLPGEKRPRGIVKRCYVLNPYIIQKGQKEGEPPPISDDLMKYFMSSNHPSTCPQAEPEWFFLQTNAAARTVPEN